MLRLPSFSLPHKPIYLAILLLIPLSSILAFYGYRYFTLAHPEQAVLPEIQAIFDSNSAVKDDPSPTSSAIALATADPSPTPSPSPTPTPTPIPLHPGPGTYNISQGDHSGPTISKVTFDPLDVKVNNQLTITLLVPTFAPADKITATLKTDSSLEQLTFTKTNTNDEYQTWTTQLLLPHSILYQYILTISATSTNGTSQVIVAPRS